MTVEIIDAQNLQSAEAQNPNEDLAVVIPVWNLRDDLALLLGQIERLGIFAEVIVADDFSDVDCSPASLGFSPERIGARLIYLRADAQRGAGHARNIGLAAVTAKNVLFFDADDQMSDALPQIWARHVAGEVPDFTIFRHSDTRVIENERRAGSFAEDERLWDHVLGAAEPEGDDVREKMLTYEDCSYLSTISAYPWNKIYRTDFLREADISCSETPVHNDIRLHWLSFLYASKVLAVSTIGAVHIIGDRPHHLTTRKGVERLCLGEILRDVTHEIRAARGHTMLMRHFLHFTDTICRWNLGQVDEDLLPQFARLAVRAYMGFTPEEFRIYAAWQPERADAIVKFLISEGA